MPTHRITKTAPRLLIALVLLFACAISVSAQPAPQPIPDEITLDQIKTLQNEAANDTGLSEDIRNELAKL